MYLFFLSFNQMICCSSISFSVLITSNLRKRIESYIGSLLYKIFRLFFSFTLFKCKSIKHIRSFFFSSSASLLRSFFNYIQINSMNGIEYIEASEREKKGHRIVVLSISDM